MLSPRRAARRLLLATVSGLVLMGAHAACLYTWPDPPEETGSGAASSTSSTSTSTSSSSGGPMDAGGDGAVTGLIAYWSFDDDGGATVFDQTGHAHDGTFTDGGARVDAGHVGWGAVFDRASGELRVPSLEQSGFPSEQGTLVMWAKADWNAPVFNQYLFSKYEAPLDAGPDADVGSNKLSIYGGAKDGGGPALYFLFVRAKDALPWWGPAPVPVLNGKWYRIAAGWDLRDVDGGRRAFRAVGNDYQSNVVSSSASLDGQDFRLGHALGGIVDEVALYDHMLTQAELEALP